jgi:hypothetical protein
MYSPLDIIKDEVARHVARMVRSKTHIILVRKPEGKEPHGISRLGWEDNIKWTLKWDGRVSTGLIWLKIATSSGLV